MVQYTFKDIEVFLLYDDLFQWVRSGFADYGFDIVVKKGKNWLLL